MKLAVTTIAVLAALIFGYLGGSKLVQLDKEYARRRADEAGNEVRERLLREHKRDLEGEREQLAGRRQELSDEVHNLVDRVCSCMARWNKDTPEHRGVRRKCSELVDELHRFHNLAIAPGEAQRERLQALHEFLTKARPVVDLVEVTTECEQIRLLNDDPDAH